MSHRLIYKAVGHLVGYAIWVLGFRLLVLTLITYFLMASNSRFQEISDTFGSNELVLMGLGALLFVLMLRWLHPMTSTTSEEIYTRYRLVKKFLPGFLHGSVLGIGIVAAFVASGSYRYLGFFIQMDEAPLAVASLAFRIAALCCLAYCEEFVFRHKFMNYVRSRVPDLASAALAALAFGLVKAMQFDLGVSQLITILLIGFALSIRTIADGDFGRSAGFWAGLLIVFHPLLSLPVLGNEFQGILLVRYQPGELEDGMGRFLTGGLGGPLSSFSVQLIFLFDIVQSVYRNKKILLNPRHRRIK